MATFYIPNPTQYQNSTTTLTINKQQLGVIEAQVIVNGLLWENRTKCDHEYEYNMNNLKKWKHWNYLGCVSQKEDHKTLVSTIYKLFFLPIICEIDLQFKK